MPTIKPLLRPHPNGLLNKSSTRLILAAAVLRLLGGTLTFAARLLLHLRRRPSRIVARSILLLPMLLLLVLQEEVSILRFDIAGRCSLLYALGGDYLIRCLSLRLLDVQLLSAAQLLLQHTADGRAQAALHHRLLDLHRFDRSQLTRILF